MSRVLPSATRDLACVLAGNRILLAYRLVVFRPVAPIPRVARRRPLTNQTIRKWRERHFRSRRK